MKAPSLLFLTLLGTSGIARAQIIKDSSAQKNWSLHLQATVIPQYHFDFKPPYAGRNSMLSSEPIRVSITNTYFIGRRLWKNAAFYFNPEVAGGRGLSGATGVAGFVNGETFRIGDPQLKLYVARAYLEQKFAIGNGTSLNEDDLNQLREWAPAKYISIRAGKFCLADFFDLNSYSHDPRTQFFNWSLMSNGAWDYPANTRGYTAGAVLEYHAPMGALRFAATQEPTEANGPNLDNHIDKSIGLTLEAEKTFLAGIRKGIVRLLLYHNKAPMGNYREAIAQFPSAPDVDNVAVYSKTKTGVGVSYEQELSKYAGLFFRAGWNDGKNQTWAFTEIDNTICAGISLDGERWGRNDDTWALAWVTNGISAPHRDYLKAGGYGFIIGDGTLNYSRETIFETYYSFSISKLFLSLSPDYQLVLNPAYNKDRGPIQVIGLRLHVQL
ncbi:MAG: carbohydrate porin [Bacteroidetes bacterium]|nr:carbohydrate porin [Bacteroidota bacterium]